MSTTVGIKLSLDGAQQAEAGLRRVKSGIEGLGGAADQVGAVMGRLAGALAGIVSVQQFIQAADAVTTLQNQLRLATGSTQAAAQAYSQLFDIAQRSRVGFTELGSTFASITRATESLGLTQAQLLTVTEAIGNAVTVSGASAQAAEAALVQLGQGLASGALRGEELNSILEQTPRLARALADGLQVSVGELRELGKEGRLSAQAVIGALQSQAAVLATEVQDSVLTVGQAFVQLRNSAIATVGEIDRVTGSSAGLAATVQAASTSLDDIARAFRGVESAAQPVGVLSESIAVVFETIAVLGVNVVYVFRQIDAEIRGIASQMVALTRWGGGLKQFNTIGEQMRSDAAAARREVDALSERILKARQLNADIARSLEGVDTRAEDAKLRRQAGLAPVPIELPKPKPKATTDSTAITSADVLRADVAAIKRVLNEYTGAYAAAETVLEARRSAGLVNEREYFEARAALIRLNGDAQIGALQQERARLVAEMATGRERVQNLTRIADIDQEIAAIRARSAAQGEALGLQDQERLQKLAQAYADAEAAARSYLETIETQYAREIAGVGQGRRQREMNTGLSQINDRYEGQRQGLAGELRRGEIDREQYEQQLGLINEYNGKAVEAYRRYYQQLDQTQRDWVNGATEALADYADSAVDVAGQVEQAFDRALGGFEDALVDFVTTGKLSFSDLANSILADIARILIRAQIVGPIAKALGGSFEFANGGVMTSAGPVELRAYASGGIARTPQMALFGEGSQPEAFVPLPDGRTIPVTMRGGGGGNVSVVINNNSSAQATATESVDSRGNRRIEVVVSEMVAGEMRRSGSGVHAATRAAFGARPALVGR